MVLDPTETQKPPSNQMRAASGTESWRPCEGRSKRSALPVDISHPAVRSLLPTDREALHFAPSLLTAGSLLSQGLLHSSPSVCTIHQAEEIYITHMGDFLETNAFSARSSEIIFSSGSLCTTVR
jgi:hypothetical protein